MEIVCDLLVERETRFECAPDWAGVSNALQSHNLWPGQAYGQMDVELHLTWCRVGVVLDIHAQIIELPIVTPRVQRDHRGGARRDDRRQQLVGRGGSVRSAEALGLIGRDRVATVDFDLMPQRSGNWASTRGKPHLDLLTRDQAEPAGSARLQRSVEDRGCASR
jgi:hypothetical protein